MGVANLSILLLGCVQCVCIWTSAAENQISSHGFAFSKVDNSFQRMGQALLGFSSNKRMKGQLTHHLSVWWWFLLTDFNLPKFLFVCEDLIASNTCFELRFYTYRVSCARLELFWTTHCLWPDYVLGINHFYDCWEFMFA